MKPFLFCFFLISLLGSVAVASTPTLTAADIDAEISAAERQVEQLRAQFTNALNQEGATIEKLLEPGADGKAIAAELDQIRARADKLQEGLRLAEKNVAEVKKGRKKRIASALELERRKADAKARAETERLEQVQAQRKREEAIAKSRRMKQEEAVRANTKRHNTKISDKALREAAIKKRVHELQQAAQAKAEKAAAKRRGKAKKEVAKVGKVRKKVDAQRDAREAERAAKRKQKEDVKNSQ